MGRLKELFTRTKTQGQRTKTQGQDNTESSKIDIYNYAARFDLVPKFSVQTVLKAGRKLIEVAIEVPEQNIRALGRGSYLKVAESGAAVNFKQAAEEYHARLGEGFDAIKDQINLTVNNCKNFFSFYRNTHPGTRVQVLYEPALERKARGIISHRAQIVLNDERVGEPIEMATKINAENLAYLTAAIAMKKRDPAVFQNFLQALKEGSGEILRPVLLQDMSITDECVRLMRGTLSRVRRAGLPAQPEELLSDEAISENSMTRRLFPLSTEQARVRDLEMRQKLDKYLQDPRLEELHRKKSELPMNQYRDRVLELINNNTYNIIVGATGSGKTTQVPQIILEDAIKSGRGSACNIICTQPRRIAAQSIARRVAEERAERLQDSVGYHVRFDPRLPASRGSILYSTTGILLKQLQNSPDRVMDDISHIIIDEVHERDMNVDFLLIVLKKTMHERLSSGRPVPKVVLMSATMDTDLFASYFQSNDPKGGLTACPALSVPGRAFPVKEMFLDEIISDMNKSYSQSDLSIFRFDKSTREYFEANARFCQAQPAKKEAAADSDTRDDEVVIDWKQEQTFSADGEIIAAAEEKGDSVVPCGLVAATIAHIANTTRQGAVLAFLPGLEEITAVNAFLRNQSILGVNFNNISKFKLFMLHSSLVEEQTEIFNSVPPGCRKIILATNIAETSITIPDVQFVVDTGKIREKQYDQIRRITSLKCAWISKSNSKQRAGRAGRVQNGNYYALFPKARFDSMRQIGLSEMLRSDLQEVCLDIKAQAFKSPIRDFLAEAIEPPSPKAVNASVLNLQALNALTSDEEITSLGRLLASLPVYPSLGKMIVLGVIFRCLDSMLILGASVAERDIFIRPLTARQEAQAAKLSFAQGSGSDHIALVNAVRALRRQRKSGLYAMRVFAEENFLQVKAFNAIESTASQIEYFLVEAGLIPPTTVTQRQNSQFGSPSLNENSSNVPLIKALVVAGVHPNLAISTGGPCFRTPSQQNTIVQGTSINAPRDRRSLELLKPGSLYTFTSMNRSNDAKSIALRDTSVTTPLMAMLFGGKVRSKAHNILEIDSWLPFYVKSRTPQAAMIVLEFRNALERLLADAFRDLSQLRTRRGENGSFLADEKYREMFAHGLVEILDEDVTKNGLGTRAGWERSAMPQGRDVEGFASRESSLDFPPRIPQDNLMRWSR